MNDHDSQFVDTNVLIYAFDNSTDDKHQKARELIQELWKNENGCISIQVLQEFYVVTTKKAPNRLDSIRAATTVRDLCAWNVHRPNTEDILTAIYLHQKFNISFWDAMIVHSARELNCGILWSEDLSNGQIYGDVKVVNPFI